MTTSARSQFDIRERLPVVEAAAARWLLALVKLALLGGVAFAVGVVAIVAMRSLGAGPGLLAAVGGPVLIAHTVERLYAA
jgi:hypothetical protein